MLRRCAGLHIPVFSLRTKKGLGTGEFLDLILLIDWCKEAGLKVIKLFPIHDTSLTETERDASPLSVLSSFSLHPNYLNIGSLAPEFEEEIKPISRVLNQPHLEYRRTFLAKNELLRMLYIIRKEEDLSSKAFERFFKKNEQHLKNYAAFLILKEKHGRPKEYSEEIVDKICEKHPEKVDFHAFVQFHLHQQLKKVVDYAEEQGIVLSVDFPVKVHPHSVDAWCGATEESKLRWIEQYFDLSDSKVTYFQLQDLLAMNDALKSPIPVTDWVHWRSHIYMEEFLLVKSFAKEIREMIQQVRRT